MFQTTDIQAHGVTWALDYIKSKLRHDMDALSMSDLLADDVAPPFYQVLAFVYEMRRNCDAHQRVYGPTDLTFHANLQARNALQMMRAAQIRVVRPQIHRDLDALHSQLESNKMQILEGMFRMHELTAGREIIHV